LFLKYNKTGLAWSLVILFLSIMPGRQIDSPFVFPHIDKLVHFIMYALQSLFFIVGFYKQNSFFIVKKYPIYIALGVSFIYGIAMELMQHFFIADRYFEWGDIAANGIGCIGGFLLFRLIFGKQCLKIITNSYNK
jgi:VanZ family protein